jgi:hypothetical protein
LQASVRVTTAKILDVRLETLLIKPTEHLVEFFAKNEPNQWHRQLLKLNRLAKHASENLCRLRIRKLAPG